MWLSLESIHNHDKASTLCVTVQEWVVIQCYLRHIRAVPCKISILLELIFKDLFVLRIIVYILTRYCLVPFYDMILLLCKSTIRVEPYSKHAVNINVRLVWIKFSGYRLFTSKHSDSIWFWFCALAWHRLPRFLINHCVIYFLVVVNSRLDCSNTDQKEDQEGDTAAKTRLKRSLTIICQTYWHSKDVILLQPPQDTLHFRAILI